MSANDYRYWAFISYSHHDKRVARWLKDALAMERIPKPFRDRTQRKKSRLEDVFLDEGSAAASHSLNDELQDALRTSRYLIVICSPFSASSTHVNEEIAFFKAQGGEKRILCLIASGVPNASDGGNPELECFPPALRFAVTSDGTVTNALKSIADRPLGADLGHETKSELAQAIRQLKAGILDISGDELAAFSRKRRLKRAVAGIGIAACLAGISGGIWHTYYRPTTTYYKDYVRRWGAWEGIDRVSATQAQAMNKVYAFDSPGAWRKPARVRFVNGSDRCAAKGIKSILGNTLSVGCHPIRACEAHFVYDSKGNITTEKLISQFGKTLETLTYTGSSVGTFTEAGFGCSRTKTGVRNIRLTRYKTGAVAGLDERIAFLGIDAKTQKIVPRENHDGVHAVRFDYDSIGRLRRKSFHTPDGAAEANKDGYAGKHYQYDDHGNLQYWEYSARDGARWTDKEHASAKRMTHDENGNVVETVILDRLGNPTRHKQGFTLARSQFDASGNEILRTWHDASGQRIWNINGISGQRYTYNKHGDVIAMQYVGVNDEIVHYRKKNYAQWRDTRDQYGSALIEQFLDAGGRLIRNSDGYAVRKRKYSPDGHVVEERFFGVDGELTFRRKDHAAIIRTKFNERGNQIESRYYGTKEELIYESEESVAIARSKHDERGNQIEGTLYDVNDKPRLGKDGYHGYRRKYNARGQIIENEYFGLDGKLVIQKRGYAREKDTYTPAGYNSSRLYFDTKGQLVKTTHGYAGWRDTFNRDGKIVQTQFIGADGGMMLVEGGYAGSRLKYDRYGNQIEKVYLGLDGKTGAHKNGFAVEQKKYDKFKNNIETAYFDVEGKPSLYRGQYSIVKRTYNKTGELLEISYFGTDGKLILYDGKASVGYAYDPRGNPVRQVNLGLDGKPVADKNGVAEVHTMFDARGNKLQKSWLDADGKHLSIEGYVTTRFKYDALGNQIEDARLGPDGQPVLQYGFATVRTMYDKYGNPIHRAYFGADDKPIGRRSGGGKIAVWERDFDYAQRIVEERHFGVDGKPVNDDKGVARITYQRDRFGKTVQKYRYSADGKRCPGATEHCQRKLSLKPE